MRVICAAICAVICAVIYAVICAVICAVIAYRESRSFGRIASARSCKKNEKRELISDIWGKRGATYGEKGGCRVGGVFFLHSDRPSALALDAELTRERLNCGRLSAESCS